jgi:hypothetical protein
MLLNRSGPLHVKWSGQRIRKLLRLFTTGL